MSSKGFTELINNLKSMVNGYENESKDFMKRVELEVVADAQLTTPVVSGDLKRSWTPDEPVKSGNSIIGIVGADVGVAYAEAVEAGHATTGGGFVQGQFILKKATERVKFEEKVERFYKSITKKGGL